VLETAVIAHAIIECILPGMTEGRVTEIVGEADRFGQRFVQTERRSDGTADLCDFHRVRDTGAIEITLMVDEYLRLVDESSKRVRMDDAIAIPLEFAAHLGGRLGVTTAARVLGGRRPGCETHSRCSVKVASKASCG